jgi:ELWxxDGT repeat protein
MRQLYSILQRLLLFSIFSIAVIAGRAQLHLIKGVTPLTFGINQQFQPLGDKLLFFVSDNTYGEEWWTTDGTTNGTHMLKDLYPGADGFANLTQAKIIMYNNLVISGSSYSIGNANGFDLVRTDGTADGTYSLANLNTPDQRNVTGFMVVGNTLFISMNHGGRLELWKTDGTPAGTRMLKDIGPTPSVSPVLMTSLNGILYFAGKDDTNGTELWKSDGTDAGTVRVRDINPGAGDGIVSATAVAISGNTLYFVADDGVHGQELWKSDGTEAGTALVKDIKSGSASSVVSSMFVLPGGTTLFVADDGVHGAELWKTDGTDGGTILVKDMLPGTGTSSPNQFVAFNNLPFFVANDGVHGRELWKSDGTSDGTVMVKDNYSGISTAVPRSMAVAGS